MAASYVPITIAQSRWGGQSSAESAAKTYTLKVIKPTVYDDRAMASLASFREVKAADTIASEVGFQVSLPTILNLVRGSANKSHRYTISAYSDSLRRLLQHIPPSELTILWDLQQRYQHWNMSVEALMIDTGRLLDKQQQYATCHSSVFYHYYLTPIGLDPIMYTRSLIS